MLEICFTKTALREWAQIDASVKPRLKKKLQELSLETAPRVRLRGFGGRLYKVKITTPQFRLVYRLDELEGQLIVIAVGHRDAVYSELIKIG